MPLTKKEFINQLEKLVSFKTVSGNHDQNALLLDYVETLIHPRAIVERITNGQAEILIASTRKTSTPDIGYMVHGDVVAASEKLFTLRQTGAIVKGRGVSDMKFSIPIGIALLNELIEKNSSVSFDFVITTDEEVGGFEGAGFLAQEIKWRPHCIIVPDGGDNVQFVTASKGVAQFKITMFGTSAHASRPWEGDNALPKIAQVIIELEKRYKRNNSKKEWETTLNFGQISGGISTNQVCDQAELKIDFRYPETDTFERIKAEVATLVTAIDTKGLVEELSIGLPTFTDSNESIVQEFIKCLSDAYQQEISVKPTYGASDARHFASYGIPILMSKPHGGDIHMESEWLDVDSTMTFYKAVHSFVKSRRS